jgi:hypothetical protein
MNMEKFCEGCNDLLPAGVQVSYKMNTETISVTATSGYGKGASMQSYHKLIFTK